MSAVTAFRLTQGFYWLFLGIWVGGMVMLVISAAVTFRTVNDYQPSLGLSPYDNPTLAEHAPRILAGAITGNALRGLRVLQIICAAVVGLCLFLQCTAFSDRLSNGVTAPANLARIALVVLPVVVLVFDSFVVSPRIWSQRGVMYDPALTPAQRESARAVFQGYHKMSERVVGLAMLSLAAAVFVSAFVFDTSTSSTPAVATGVAAAERDAPRG